MDLVVRVAELIVVRDDSRILFFGEGEKLRLPRFYKNSRITKADMCAYLLQETRIFTLEHEFGTLDIPDPHPCLQRFIIQNVDAMPVFRRPAVWGDMSELRAALRSGVQNYNPVKNQAI